MNEKCADYFEALSNAQYEGWGGAVKDSSKKLFTADQQKQDVLAIERAEGEGMMGPLEPVSIELVAGTEQTITSQESAKVPVLI